MYTRHTVVTTRELGDLTLVAADRALVGIYFERHWTMPDAATFGAEVDGAADRVLAEAAVQLRQYLGGERTTFELATSAQGGRVRGTCLGAAGRDPVRRDDDLRRGRASSAAERWPGGWARPSGAIRSRSSSAAIGLSAATARSGGTPAG